MRSHGVLGQTHPASRLAETRVVAAVRMGTTQGLRAQRASRSRRRCGRRTKLSMRSFKARRLATGAPTTSIVLPPSAANKACERDLKHTLRECMAPCNRVRSVWHCSRSQASCRARGPHCRTGLAAQRADVARVAPLPSGREYVERFGKSRHGLDHLTHMFELLWGLGRPR